jgi:PAS domain S-box-containing protein
MAATKYRMQLFAASQRVTLQFRRAQNALATLGRNVAERLRARAKDLLESSQKAVVLTSGDIAKCRTQLFAASEQVTLRLRQAQNRLTTSVGQKLQQALRARKNKALRTRENDLRKLLASALDAVVVTDVDHRFLAANPKALDLFGVSGANLRNFTIDAFLPRGQILYFDGNGSPFIGREVRHGECKIRRMDGSLRAAEYSFVANFVPRRHLCRFRNVKATQVKFIPTFNYGRGNDSNSGRLR